MKKIFLILMLFLIASLVMGQVPDLAPAIYQTTKSGTAVQLDSTAIDSVDFTWVGYDPNLAFLHGYITLWDSVIVAADGSENDSIRAYYKPIDRHSNVPVNDSTIVYNYGSLSTGVYKYTLRPGLGFGIRVYWESVAGDSGDCEIDHYPYLIKQ